MYACSLLRKNLHQNIYSYQNQLYIRAGLQSTKSNKPQNASKEFLTCHHELMLKSHFFTSFTLLSNPPLIPTNELHDSDDKKEVDNERKNNGKKSLWLRFKNECKHYYNGFKLLGLDVVVAFKLCRRILKGHALTRRERHQLMRTVADLIRMIPFLVFILVPFMEFLLPFFIKFFPNMLPSTFQEKKTLSVQEKKLAARIELSKFLQKTIKETKWSESNLKKKNLTEEFAIFMEKVRKEDYKVSNEEILKFSKLFENELTMDSLNRVQLVALCKLLDIQAIGTSYLLRLKLSLQLGKIRKDDYLIRKEGIDTLEDTELQTACRVRGMRALGLSQNRLQLQLKQWLELHLDYNIPTSLLLLSRTMFLPGNTDVTSQIKETIASLPERAEDLAKIEAAKSEGDEIDAENLVKVIKEEQEEIEAERKQRDEEEIETVSALENESDEVLEEKDENGSSSEPEGNNDSSLNSSSVAKHPPSEFDHDGHFSPKIESNLESDIPPSESEETLKKAQILALNNKKLSDAPRSKDEYKV